MLRIFGHFVPLPALLVGLCEIFLISLALLVALGPAPAEALQHLHFISPSAQFTAGFTGLAIGAYQTRELIRTAGGELEVVSSPGAGTTTRIVLPLASEGAVSTAA